MMGERLSPLQAKHDHANAERSVVQHHDAALAVRKLSQQQYWAS